MFSRYTAQQASAAALGTSGWAAVKDAASRMGEKAVLAWAQDYHVVPDMLPRPAFLALAREAVRT